MQWNSTACFQKLKQYSKEDAKYDFLNNRQPSEFYNNGSVKGIRGWPLTVLS